MLTESLIICEPNSAGKMAVRSQDQQLILHEIFPVVREVRDQDEGKSGKGLHPRSDVLDVSPLFFFVTVVSLAGKSTQVDRLTEAEVPALSAQG